MQSFINFSLIYVQINHLNWIEIVLKQKFRPKYAKNALFLLKNSKHCRALGTPPPDPH